VQYYKEYIELQPEDIDARQNANSPDGRSPR